jgi:hypothetical protein
VSFEALQQTLEQAMKDGWTATPVFYENTPFKAPSAGAWIVFTVAMGPGTTFGIDGSTKYARDTGLVSAQIFVPIGAGTKESRELIDAFIALFELAEFTGGISTYAASVTTLGVVGAGTWHQVSVTIPYRRDRNV